MELGRMIEFFFDCSSPWTYLAFHNVLPLAGDYNEAIAWRPILVGGIFNTINPSVYRSREKPVPAKVHYAQKDLADWAHHAGLKIIRPTVFPVNSVKAMRGCILLAPEGKLVVFARAVFEAYWGDDRDISNDGVLAEVCASVGVDGRSFFAGISQQSIKDKLRQNTDELIARGGLDHQQSTLIATTCILAMTVCHSCALPSSDESESRGFMGSVPRSLYLPEAVRHARIFMPSASQ